METAMQRNKEPLPEMRVQIRAFDWAATGKGTAALKTSRASAAARGAPRAGPTPGISFSPDGTSLLVGSTTGMLVINGTGTVSADGGRQITGGASLMAMSAFAKAGSASACAPSQAFRHRSAVCAGPCSRRRTLARRGAVLYCECVSVATAAALPGAIPALVPAGSCHIRPHGGAAKAATALFRARRLPRAGAPYR
mgnify:CR=1 FL=1